MEMFIQLGANLRLIPACLGSFRFAVSGLLGEKGGNDDITMAYFDAIQDTEFLVGIRESAKWINENCGSNEI